MQRREEQPAAGLKAVGQDGQEPVGVQVRHGADGVDQVVRIGVVQVGHGVRAHQVQTRDVRVAGEGTLVLGGGGIHGGDVGAPGGEVSGVPAKAAAKVEDAQPVHVTKGFDAGTDVPDAPVPPVQLGQLQPSGQLVGAVDVPGLDGVRLSGHQVLHQIAGGGGQGRRA